MTKEEFTRRARFYANQKTQLTLLREQLVAEDEERPAYLAELAKHDRKGAELERKLSDASRAKDEAMIEVIVHYSERFEKAGDPKNG